MQLVHLTASAWRTPMGLNVSAIPVLWVIRLIAQSTIAPATPAPTVALVLAAEMVIIAPARLNGEERIARST